MGTGKKLVGELNDWVTLAIVIVIGSVVLLKFKDVDGVTSGLNSTIDSFVTALSEPKNWITIFVVALIGGAILMFFRKQNK